MSPPLPSPIHSPHALNYPPASMTSFDCETDRHTGPASRGPAHPLLRHRAREQTAATAEEVNSSQQLDLATELHESCTPHVFDSKRRGTRQQADGTTRIWRTHEQEWLFGNEPFNFVNTARLLLYTKAKRHTQLRISIRE